MKKKGKKKYIVICAIALVIVSIFAWMFNSKSDGASTSTTSTKIVEVAVSTQTIQNTLTGSGQIETSATDKISLSTSKYFSTMCAEEDDTVLKGENILKYSNGTYLTAPYDLVISSYSVPETGSVCTSSNYIEVQNLETLQMSLSIDESQINSVKVGQSVEITLSADETKKYDGKISKINAIGTYSTSGSSFTATVQFENDGDVKIGMSASCTVVLEEAVDCISVPVAAIQTSGDSKYVVVVNADGTTKDVTVETGISNDSYVQILSGLEGNETVQMLQTTSTSGIRSSSKNSSSTTSSLSGFGGGKGSQAESLMGQGMQGGVAPTN